MGGSNKTTSQRATQATKIPKEIRERGSTITKGAMNAYFDPATRYQPFSYNQQDQQYGAARTGQLNQYHTQGGQQSQGAQHGWQPYYNAAGQQAQQSTQGGYTQGPNYNSQTVGRFMNPFMNHVIGRGAQEIGRNLNLQRLDNQSRAAGAGAFGGARHGVVDAEAQRTAADTLQNFIGSQLNQGFGHAVNQFNTDFAQRMGANQQNYQQGMGYANFLQGQGTDAQGRYLAGQQSANNQGNVIMAQEQAQKDAALAERDQAMNYPMDVYERLAGINAMQPVNRTSTMSGTATQSQSGGWLGPVMNAAGTAIGAFSDENTKEDIEDVDAEEVLGAFSQVEPKSYNYKPEFVENYPDLTQPGRRTGFMAQDLEKAFGSKNQRVDGFQVVDTNEMIGRIVAAIHGLEKRTRPLKEMAA